MTTAWAGTATRPRPIADAAVLPLPQPATVGSALDWIVAGDPHQARFALGRAVVGQARAEGVQLGDEWRDDSTHELVFGHPFRAGVGCMAVRRPA